MTVWEYERPATVLETHAVRTAGAGSNDNVIAALGVDGSLDMRLLADSMAALHERHAALRTAFRMDAAGVRAIVGGFAAPSGFLLDLRRIAPDLRLAELRRWVLNEAGRPVDLGAGPLWQWAIVRLFEQTSVVVVVAHRSVFDDVSAMALLLEVRSIYKSLGRGDALSDLGADAVAGCGQRMARVVRGGAWDAHWSRVLSTEPPGFPVGGASAEGWFAVPLREVSSQLAGELVRLARAHGSGMVGALRAVVIASVWRYLGSGVVVGGMEPYRAGIGTARVIGSFGDYLPVFAALDDGVTFVELLGRLHAARSEALRFAAPHAEILSVSAGWGRVGPPFAVGITVRARPPRAHDQPLAARGVTFSLRHLETGGLRRFVDGDVNDVPGLRYEFETGHTGAVAGHLLMRTPTFDATFRQRLVRAFGQAVELCITRPRHPIATLMVAAAD